MRYTKFMLEYILSFLAGGTITTLIIYFENSGYPLLSRLAALFPVFTWLSYLFIGKLAGAQEVARHSLFVLLGTLCAWVPYMLTIYFFAPRMGVPKAIGLGILVFVALASVFIYFYKA